MIKIDVKQRTGNGPDYKMYTVDVPALPRVGDHMASDKDGFSGYVKGVMFWWDEDGELTIEAEIK